MSSVRHAHTRQDEFITCSMATRRWSRMRAIRRSHPGMPTYPDDDLQAILGSDGKWRYLHKDGNPY